MRRRCRTILEDPFLGRVVVCGSMVPKKVHLGPGYSRKTACGGGGKEPELTRVLSRVTCGRCRRWIRARPELGGADGG